MQITKLAASAAVLAVAGHASAGTAVGLTLGGTVGSALGLSLGDTLPLAGSGVLLLGAAMLGVGVYIARRKRR